MSAADIERFESLPVQRFALSNGVELHGVIEGEGTPLVFIHGAMGDWRSWAPQWADFSAHYRCLSYSRRYSHPNRNEMPSPHHSALIEAQDLRLLLDALGWSRAILVGSSYGAFTALAFALEHPERVIALAAAEPPMMRYADLSEAGRREREAFRREVIEPANAAFRAGDDALAAQIMTGGINGGSSSAASAAGMVRRMQNVRAMRMLALSSDEFPWLAPAALDALTVPMLLMAGDRTPAIHDAIFRNLVACLPKAQVARISKAGHGSSRDHPTEFNAVVLAFLAQAEPER